MSGPKVDFVELERQRQIELERQRMERLRKIRIETEKLNGEVTKCKLKLKQIENHLTQLVFDVRESADIASTLARLNELKYKYVKQFNMTVDIDIPSEPQDIYECSCKLSAEMEGLLTAMHNDVKPFEERILDYKKQIALLDKVNTMAEGFSAKVEKLRNIGTIVDIDFGVKLTVVPCELF